MSKKLCHRCHTNKAALRRPKTSEQVCQTCFFAAFEQEIHDTIVSSKLFHRGEKVAIGASGGKDSTVLAHILTTLNRRHDYGLDLFLLSIDEGITGYRDDSLDTVKRNEQQYGIPLTVVSYKQLYGWTMDEIVSQIGTSNNCTFCGVFRRQALDRGAHMVQADKVATGHNADDMAETVLLNLLRGDLPRLSRCTAVITGQDSALPRVKPFKHAYEKEIVMYAHFKRLDYFSTECVYAPFAARGFARDFIKELEAVRPRAILDVIRSAEDFTIDLGAQQGQAPQPRRCERCSYICSQAVCKACQLLEGLNKGLPGHGVRRTAKARSSPSVTAASAEPGEAPACAQQDCACLQPQGGRGHVAGTGPDARADAPEAPCVGSHVLPEAPCMLDPWRDTDQSDAVPASKPPATDQQPAPVKGYLANLHDIAAHPSARQRPVASDRNTGW